MDDVTSGTENISPIHIYFNVVFDSLGNQRALDMLHVTGGEDSIK